MKNNKTIVGIITIAVIALTTFIVVSCNKDTVTHEVNTTPAMPQTKLEGGYLAELTQNIIKYWHICDSVYCKDTGAFMAVCRSNNYSNFYSTTGITAVQVAVLDSLIQLDCQAYDMAHSSGGNHNMGSGVGGNNSVTPCMECSSGSLLRIGEAIKDIRDFINANSISNPTALMAPYDGMDEWLRECIEGCMVRYSNTSDSLSICNRGCYLMNLYGRVREAYNALEPNFE